MADEEAPPERAAGTTPENAPLILLCEDEPMVRLTTSMALARDGFQVLEAATAEDALETAAAEAGKAEPRSIDLLITDIVLPTMKGQELAEKVVAFFPSLKLLFVSGHSGLVLDEERLRPGSWDFLQKPYRSATLLERARALLEGRER